MIFNDEQKMLRQTLREFCTNEVEPVMPEILRTNSIPRALFKRCGDLGFIRAGMPVDRGGLGEVGVCIVMEELARVSPGLAMQVELNLVQLPIILQEQALIDKYLEGTLSGDLLVAGSATDPKGQINAAEWDPMLTPDGDGYRVNGVRYYTTNNTGDLNIILGMDQNRDMKAIFVEDGMEGFVHDDVALKLGIAGNAGGTSYFNNVWIPKENVTYAGVSDDAHFYMVCVGCAAEALGNMKGMYEKVIPWLTTRTHDFKPLIEHKGIAYKVAYLKTLIEMADSMVYDAAQLCDAAEATKDPELMKAWFIKSKSTKVRVSEIGAEVCKECLKLFGGLGYHDPMIYHHLGDSMDYVIMDQTNEIHFDAILGLMGLA